MLSRIKRSVMRRILGYRPPAELDLWSCAQIAAWPAVAPCRQAPEPLTIPKHARIALVGNGPLRSGLGRAIDAHDIVIRFNACQTYGVGGWRIDVLALSNTGPVGQRFARADRRLNRMAVALAREVWMVRPPGFTRFATEPASADADRRPPNYARQIAEQIAPKPVWLASADLYRQTQERLEALGARTDQVPSTGMVVLARLKEEFAPVSVTLFGFSHEGYGGHPWEAERKLVGQWSDWVARGDGGQPGLSPKSWCRQSGVGSRD